MIIGLTGRNASGKGEVAEYLKSKGFVYLSLSDELREEATNLGIEHTRDNLIKLGNELREKYGPNYLAAKINDKIKQQLKKYNKKNSISNNINNKNIELKTNEKINKTIINKNNNQINENIINNKNNDKIKNNNGANFVVDSIRSPFEAKELMKNIDFILVGIDAPVELRFKRLLKRKRAGDAKTLEEFKQQEERENLNNATNQQLDKTFKLSKKVILNDGSLKQLHKKIDDVLLQLKNKIQ